MARQRLRSGLVLALFLRAATAGFSQDDDARRISEWIADLGAPGIQARERATEQLARIGRQAEPAFREATQSNDEETRSRVGLLLRLLEVRNSLSRSFLSSMAGADWRVANGAWMPVLQEAREKRESVSRGEIDYLFGPALTQAASSAERLALCQIAWLFHLTGSRIVPLLKDKDPDVREKSLSVLRLMSAVECAPEVAGLLSDSDPGVRCEAIATLGEFSAKEYAPQIAGLLRDEDPGVRYWSATALGAMKAREYLPDIARLLRDKASQVRQGTVDVLADLEAREQAPAIAGLLEDEDAEVRSSAVSALHRLGATEYSHAIAAQLRDQDANVRMECARTLGEFRAREFVLPIARLFRDEDEAERVRSAAIDALGVLNAAEYAGEIAQFLDSPSPRLAWSAIHALRRLGARGLVVEIAGLLGHEKDGVRVAAVHALGALGTEHQVPEVAKLLQDDSPWVRQEATAALLELGEVSAAESLLDNGLIPRQWTLHRILRPEAWKRLNARPQGKRFEGTAREALGFLAKEIGVQLMIRPKTSHERECLGRRIVVTEWHSFRELIADIVAHRLEYVLDGNLLYVVTPEEARSFWEEAWKRREPQHQ